MEPVADRDGNRARAPIGRALGKYTLLAAIGRGGMGEVYLAMAHGLAGFRKLVVLKCMHAASADEENIRTMFLDEAMLAARLSHQNVVQTYEAGELDGLPYIAMEYLEGQPLSRLTRVVPMMHPRMAAHIISEVLAGLHYAHQLRDFDGTHLAIVHRDLSPPNIFVTYDGVVKVVDFGIAKTSLASRAKTEAGVFKGKIAYMAPEQATHEGIDHRADIFSVGAVLWELVAGKRLFRELSPALTLKRLLHDEIPTLSSERPDVDPALDAIVRRALERNPEARYADALQMRQDLQRFLQSGPHVNWDAELATLMGEKFTRQRQKVQQQIQVCMSREAESRAELPSVSLTETSSGRSGTRYVPVSLDMTAMSTSTLIESSSGIGDIQRVDQTIAEPPRLDFSSVGSVATASRNLVTAAPASRSSGIGLVLGGLVIAAATAFTVLSSTQDTAIQSAPLHTEGAALGSIEILSTPPGAMVFVNGEPSGLVTPAVLKGLPIGRDVTLRIDKAGYQAKEETIEIAGAAMSPRSFQLAEAIGVLSFSGAPANARVYVDDIAVAERADGEIGISVGSHRIRLETGGALVFSGMVEIVPGEQTIDVDVAQGVR